jgi:NTE family protein
MSQAHEGKRLNLALQGGGSHGALTWGVLDRLLEDERIGFDRVSGTSAGAMNAAVLADGFARGGRAGAREALAGFWRAISDAARFSPLRRSLWDKLWGRYSLDHSPGYLWMEGLSRMFSPYELNPLGLNPLREIVETHVDFDRVAASPIDVYVTATNVRTGQPRVFTPGELTVDAVMASACLPQLYPAVEIDGQAYWDGGFVGNPALYPLLESGTPDILIVQINPVVRPELPRSARDIMNRVNEISFNSSLIKELRSIAAIQRLAAERGLDLGTRGQVLLHLIHTDLEVKDLSASSKLNAEWSYLRLLFGLGRKWAGDWLAENYERIGVASTIDLDELFGETGPLTPRVEAAAREA